MGLMDRALRTGAGAMGGAMIGDAHNDVYGGEGGAAIGAGIGAAAMGGPAIIIKLARMLKQQHPDIPDEQAIQLALRMVKGQGGGQGGSAMGDMAPSPQLRGMGPPPEMGAGPGGPGGGMPPPPPGMGGPQGMPPNAMPPPMPGMGGPPPMSGPPPGGPEPMRGPYAPRPNPMVGMRESGAITQKVIQLQQELRKFPPGSPEHQEILQELEAIKQMRGGGG